MPEVVDGKSEIMKYRTCAFAFIVIFMPGAAACSRTAGPPAPWYKLSGPLVSSKTTMATAWEFPKNPLKDPTLDDSKLSNEIRLGFRIFTDTPHAAPQFTP